MNYQPPQWLAWSLFGFGWFMAILLTYRELRTQKVELARHLDKIKNARPIPQVIARVINNEAILEVHNNGATASFKATARIIGGVRNNHFYELQWNPASDLNKGGMARILLAGIPSKFLVLYDNKGQPFVYLSQEEEKEIELKERYPNSYSDMGGVEPPEDSCVLEVTVTAIQAEPVIKRYILQKDVQGNLLFTEIVPTLDKELLE